MPLLFALTMFVSATLLFLVQPMIGKMVLPLLGGTPAVWNTCMVFYQALLLGGYYYAHRTTSTGNIRRQTAVHAVVMLAALGVLLIAAVLSVGNSPIPIVKSLSPQGTDYPFFGVIVLLAVAIGLPFFVVSTSAPLLQKWFGETGHPSARDPYFLYAASNFGSLLALIAYPAVVEPNLRLIWQAWIWAIGYGMLVALVILCARAVRRAQANAKTAAPAPKGTKPKPSPTPARTVDDAPPTTMRKIRWVALAFVPSSLMLGVTTYVSTDMASIPLLWIIPLSLYLITFIIVFSRVPDQVHLIMTLMLPVVVLLLTFLVTSEVKAKFGMKVLLHMATFFVAAMVCHGELARDRPSTKHLTNFYLLMSVGGMLGGLFNALVAPIVFTQIYEYPITLVVACLLLPNLFPDRKVTQGTYILDAILPLLIFFICRQLQANKYELGEYVYQHGTQIIAGLALFAIPAAIAIGLLEKEVIPRIALAIFLGVSLVLFGVVGPLVGWIGSFQEGGIIRGMLYFPTRLGAGEGWVPTIWRWTALAAPVGAYAWYCWHYTDRSKIRQRLAAAYGALAASLAVMFLGSDMVVKDFLTDMRKKRPSTRWW